MTTVLVTVKLVPGSVRLRRSTMSLLFRERERESHLLLWLSNVAQARRHISNRAQTYQSSLCGRKVMELHGSVKQGLAGEGAVRKGRKKQHFQPSGPDNATSYYQFAWFFPVITPMGLSTVPRGSRIEF